MIDAIQTEEFDELTTFAWRILLSHDLYSTV